MARKLLTAILGGLPGFIVGYISGGITGMQIFGNYYTSVTFLGARGYEAGILVGGIIGGTAGIAIGVFLAFKIAAYFKKDSNQ